MLLDRCPDIFHNCIVKNEDMHEAIDKLLEYGLIDRDKQFTIKHTEKGECVYEVVVMCIPEFMNVKTLIYWRNRAYCIVTGEITECEYISEVIKYVRNTIKQSASLIDTEEIWRRAHGEQI